MPTFAYNLYSVAKGSLFAFPSWRLRIGLRTAHDRHGRGISRTVGLKVVTLELCFGVKERRIGSRVTRTEGVGATTQAPKFGFKFVHRGLSSEKWCHAASL
ncbi:hypothetical protein [Bradyrhizobium sp. AZCC 2289]|uniref:hypothetical protein n=1 Tax=Bradyrhizobium sp. AZCC 2289 TaxID=3117026 RepID=UPI002FF329C9